MDKEPEEIKTTLGTRISTGLVNALLGGGLYAAGHATVVGAGKLFKVNGMANMKLASPLSWKLTGVAAAALGLYGFITADRSKEVAKEKALADLMDPTKGTDKERSAAFDKQWDAIEQGDLSNLKKKSETHFQDKVAASRAEAATERSA